MIDNPVRVEGLSELFRAFEKADKGLGREVRSALKDAGEVVRVAAEEKARAAVAAHRGSPIGAGWDRARLGMYTDIVYLVPKNRGVRSRGFQPAGRPKFGRLLLDEAYVPALDENRARVVKEVEDAIDNLNQNAGLIKNLHNI